MLLQHAQKTNTSTGSNINLNKSGTGHPISWKLSSKYQHHQKRRSSFPVADYSQNCIQLATSKKTPPGKNINALTTTNVVTPVNSSQQFKELTMERMKKLIQTGRHAFSLDSNAECKQWLIKQPRRRSIPQDILIESIRNYK